jgi:two-component system, LytTR family, response regulator AlgR
MKILISDDEELARDRLRGLLEDVGNIDVVGEAHNGKETLTQCHRLNPDIVLLDIRMPGMDGLETAFHLAALEKPPAVIFTTAYGDHALEAFEANAVDYLLKPIRRQRLHQALEKTHHLNRAQLLALKEDNNETHIRSHICIQTYDSIQLIAVPDIIYFLADQKYVTVRHIGGEVLIEESLVTLEQEFSEKFTRVHRNALIANDFIKGVEKMQDGSHRVILRDCDTRLTISRRHVAALRKKIHEVGR